MGSSKISQVHVYLIGGVLMLIVGLGLWFALIKPINDKNAEIAADIATKESTTASVDGKPFTIAQADAAQKALETLEARVQTKTAQLASLEGKKQLPRSQRIYIPASLPDKTATDRLMLTRTMPNWLLLPQRVVEQMTQFSQRLARKHGVTVVTDFAAPAPSSSPDLVRRDIVAWTLGGMSVTGDFNRVMQWARDWNSAPLLVSVDGLRCQIADKPGRVNASASLTVFIFPTGPGVQQATGGGAGGAGAAMGGAGMGMMGGNGPGMDMMGGNGPGFSGDAPGGPGLPGGNSPGGQFSPTP